MRLFVALPVDGAVRSLLKKAVSHVAGQLVPFPTRTIPSERWHLTLRFLGDGLTEAQMEQVKASLAQPFLLSPFSLTFDRLDWFPSRQRPVVLAALPAYSEVLHQLHGEVSERMAEVAGVAPASFSFRPHVSLMRPVHKAAGKVPVIHQPLRPGPILQVDRVVLYQSVQAPDGLRHVPLQVTPLQG